MRLITIRNSAVRALISSVVEHDDNPADVELAAKYSEQRALHPESADLSLSQIVNLPELKREGAELGVYMGEQWDIVPGSMVVFWTRAQAAAVMRSEMSPSAIHPSIDEDGYVVHSASGVGRLHALACSFHR